MPAHPAAKQGLPPSLSDGESPLGRGAESRVLTELGGRAVALREALRRREAAGRRGYNVGGEGRGRRGRPSAGRGGSVATCNTQGRVSVGEPAVQGEGLPSAPEPGLGSSLDSTREHLPIACPAGTHMPRRGDRESRVAGGARGQSLPAPLSPALGAFLGVQTRTKQDMWAQAERGARVGGLAAEGDRPHTLALAATPTVGSETHLPISQGPAHKVGN